VRSRITQIGVAVCLALAAAGTVASSFVTVACGNQCDRNPNEPAVLYTGGNTLNPGTPFASYESSPGDGPYLPFPAGRTYRFTHGLGGSPRSWELFVSFSPSPIATTDGGRTRGGSAICAGNQCTLERITPTVFEVRNDTCSDVYLRVAVSLPTLLPAEAGSAPVTAPDAAAPPAMQPDAASP
jgi:hypothetical protein